MEFGVERMMSDFGDLNYQVSKVEVGKKVFIVIPDYEIPIGKFTGRTIGLGIEVMNDFPNRVASAIHVKSIPHLLDKEDTIPKVRNIIDSPLGSEWRYWSHNFGWGTEKSLRRLMNQIKGVFARV